MYLLPPIRGFGVCRKQGKYTKLIALLFNVMLIMILIYLIPQEMFIVFISFKILINLMNYIMILSSTHVRVCMQETDRDMCVMLVCSC
jgi:L-asparagine transporter-like permease